MASDTRTHRDAPRHEPDPPPQPRFRGPETREERPKVDEMCFTCFSRHPRNATPSPWEQGPDGKYYCPWDKARTVARLVNKVEVHAQGDLREKLPA